MAQFVQLGKRFFNPNHVTDGYLCPDESKVVLFLGTQDGDVESEIVFKDSDYESFLDWWEHKAEVDRR